MSHASAFFTRLRLFASLSILGFVVASGCGPSHPNEKEVFKVVGIVTVDGKPTGDIQIGFHNVAGADNNQPTYPQGFTDSEGKMKVSTYAEGDGVPPGEYKVTFSLQEYNVIARSFGGPDKLKKKYADPKTTPITVKVSGLTDMGEVKLTTTK